MKIILNIRSLIVLIISLTIISCKKYVVHSSVDPEIYETKFDSNGDKIE
jgi:hypothetical protein